MVFLMVICGGNKLSPFNFLPKGIWWRELCGQVVDSAAFLGGSYLHLGIFTPCQQR